jgi:hypothetical protein
MHSVRLLFAVFAGLVLLAFVQPETAFAKNPPILGSIAQPMPDSQVAAYSQLAGHRTKPRSPRLC